MELPEVITPCVNTDTALGQALISMFKSVEAELELVKAGPGAVKIILFGGCAVHLYTHHRVSTDVDAEIYEAHVPEGLHLQTMLAEIPEQFVDERSGRLMELNYDLQCNTGLAQSTKTIGSGAFRLQSLRSSPRSTCISPRLSTLPSPSWAERPIRTSVISRHFSGLVSY